MEAALIEQCSLVRGYLLNPQTPRQIVEAFDMVVGAAARSVIVVQTKQKQEAIEKPVNASTHYDKMTRRPAAATVKRRARKCKLTLDNLPDIQRDHDAGQPNGVIAAPYGVSDQTIVNFLRKNGTYNPQATGGRPKRPPAPPELPKEDMLGDKLVTPKLIRSLGMKVLSVKKKTINDFGPFQPGDLVDMHDMLAQGKDTSDIAEYFTERDTVCTKIEVEEFILIHQNVQITRCAPAYNPQIVGKKNYGGRPESIAPEDLTQ